MKPLILAASMVIAAIFMWISSTRTSIKQSAPMNFIYCAPSFDPDKLDAKNAPIFQGLGSLRYPVTTKSEQGQQYFNQGLTLVYAFNHGEAGRSFKALLALDSTCAMGWWGLAMVLGPNYNAALNPTKLEDINIAIDNAIKYSIAATEKEKAFINALSKRFPREQVSDMKPFAHAYAVAMEKVHARFPTDPEVGTLYADALMNEHPWNLWLKDGKQQPWTGTILKTLESVLASVPKHPGANHLYVHAIEASRTPEKAMRSADILLDLLPAAGHLVHMPAHIYIRTGDYQKGVAATEASDIADSSYVAQCKVKGLYPLMYYPHNIHFLAACALLQGNSRKAIDAAWSVSRHADQEFINDNITVQHYYIIPYYVLVQTAKWNEIMQLEKPRENLRYPIAIWHYARGMAFIARGKIAEARTELSQLASINKEDVLGKQLIWETNTAAQLTQIAFLLLSGEINAQQGNFKPAITQVKEAMDIEDGLMYQEPPDWFFSTRHTMGHIMLKAKKYAAAEKIYLDDMKTYPENGWALMGLYQSLAGQGKTEEAAIVKERFSNAWQWADMKITSSRAY